MSLLTVRDLQTHFKLPKGVLRAVDGVSFSIAKGETVGLVGESGCGKSTLGRSLLRLETPTAGQVALDGEDILPLQGARLRSLRKRMQMIFQDPFASLNPRHSIGTILETPLQVHGLGDRAQRRRQVERLLDRVGLPRSALGRAVRQVLPCQAVLGRAAGRAGPRRASTRMPLCPNSPASSASGAPCAPGACCGWRFWP